MEFSIEEADPAFETRRPTMSKKLSLVFALVTALVALPVLGGMAFAQGGFPKWGECTTNYYGHGCP